MKNFMDDNFLLENEKAKELYEQVKNLPIFDYHCHLSPQEIYENRVFHNLTELWLEADHYKWRVMRNAGVSEFYITGNADPYEKFLAFARALPLFPGNPVYHWAHLELKKYFGITIPLSEITARDIWQKTEKMMADGRFCARNLIRQSNVDTIFTTDDPVSDLKYHALLKAEYEKAFSTSTQNLQSAPDFCVAPTFRVAPSFRPDRAVNIEKSDFTSYIKELEKTSGVIISDVSSLLAALENRLKFFVDNGCVIADISFSDFPLSSFKSFSNENYDKIMTNANLAFKKKMTNVNFYELNMTELSDYEYCVIKELALLFKKYDITMQVHTGVQRNVNSVMFSKIGADSGIDSVGNAINIEAAGILFNDIEKSSGKTLSGGLPRTILYTLNPTAYYPIATMIGDFAGEIDRNCTQKYDISSENASVPVHGGRMQLGAAWWFMDHRDGIKEQLKIFANTSGLGVFNGMLTDSRSFVSYARHDYFRRVLCSLIGEWIENGEYPDDENAIQLVKNISFYNAKNNFGSSALSSAPNKKQNGGSK